MEINKETRIKDLTDKTFRLSCREVKRQRCSGSIRDAILGLARSNSQNSETARAIDRAIGAINNQARCNWGAIPSRENQRRFAFFVAFEAHRFQDAGGVFVTENPRLLCARGAKPQVRFSRNKERHIRLHRVRARSH